MIDDVGSFDEDIFLYHEETDLDWRARLRGWRCWYVPGAVGVHPGYRITPHLRVEVIGNRYLSAIKNADAWALWTRVLPRLLAHLPLRIVLTPRFGWRLARHIWRKARRFYRKRGERCRPLRPGAPPVDLRPWYAWAVQQPHRSPTSFRRIRPPNKEK
jgi:GT2 family glycosyltransferase